MMRRILSICLLSLFSASAFAAKHTVISPGFSFSPDVLTVNVGDTIIFAIGNNHNVREVSQTTWTNNGSSALSGGFSLPFGGGQVVIASPGDHYYVCVPHAGGGMKGMITANTTSGNLSFRKQDNPFSAKVTNQKLNINFTNSEAGSVSIYDLLGNKLFQSAANDDLIISLVNFKTGIYFVVLNDQRGRYTQRFSYKKED